MGRPAKAAGHDTSMSALAKRWSMQRGEPCRLLTRVGMVAVSLMLALLPSSLAFELVLPTPNKAIFEGGPKFYMHVNRDFQGVRSTPWEGGQFGFVRTPVMVEGVMVYKKFHEGIDIRPVRRAADGEPLDPVFAISSGVVRHVSTNGRSNYGNYVVIEHNWDDSPVYSLYAHLSDVHVKEGDRVQPGDTIARMGYTGSGIDKTRAHLHLEICLLYSNNFEAWHQQFFADSPNHHGLFNGLNLFSVDPVALYKARRDNPALSFAAFVRSQPAFFKVRLPAGVTPDVIKRYPWLVREGSETTRARAWELGFTAYGLVVSAEASDVAATEPKLTSVKSSRIPYSYVTRGWLTGRQGSAALSSSGLRSMKLLTYPD